MSIENVATRWRSPESLSQKKHIETWTLDAPPQLRLVILLLLLLGVVSLLFVTLSSCTCKEREILKFGSILSAKQSKVFTENGLYYIQFNFSRFSKGSFLLEAIVSFRCKELLLS